MKRYWAVVAVAVVLLLFSITLEGESLGGLLAVIVMQLGAFWSITWAFSKLFRSHE